MKKIIIVLFLLAIGTYCNAQTLDTVVLVSKAKKFKAGDHILVSFEIMDTLDASGKKVTVSRSYYFDQDNRTISSVREYYNPKKPEKGLQVIYSFGANKLTSVMVVPPASTCKNCASHYYFLNDAVSSKQEKGYTHPDPALFVKQAHSFQSRLPHDLPWGFFDDEVFVNGVKKKIKKQY